MGLSGAGPAGLGVVQDTRLHDSCDVVAVHDADADAAKSFATGSRIGLSTGDFDELLGTGVDFVVLTGPLDERLSQVQRASRSVVPCLLHAPMAPDLATAREMTAHCERHEVRLGVYAPSQADPVVEQLRRMIAADWLGGVVFVQSIVGDDELLRSAPTSPTAPMFNALCTDHVHLATWLTGRPAVSVTAQTTSSFGTDLDDGGVATVVLRGNVPCTYLAEPAPRADAFAIHGTDGGLRVAGDRIWLCGQRAAFDGHVFSYETPGIEQVLNAP